MTIKYLQLAFSNWAGAITPCLASHTVFFEQPILFFTTWDLSPHAGTCRSRFPDPSEFSCLWTLTQCRFHFLGEGISLPPQQEGACLLWSILNINHFKIYIKLHTSKQIIFHTDMNRQRTYCYIEISILCWPKKVTFSFFGLEGVRADLSVF